MGQVFVIINSIVIYKYKTNCQIFFDYYKGVFK